MATFLSSTQTLKDFEPESFILEKFIEKLAQLDPNTGLGPLSKKKDVPFDQKVLLASFKQSLGHLQDMNDKVQKRIERLEFVCAKQERDHTGRVRELEPIFQEAFNEFQVLEDRITYVARKVVHLGDQLESSNTHRQRDIDAQRLLEIMKDFQEKSKPSRPEFTEPGRLTEAADLIYKLNALAAELPRTEELIAMRKNIADRYAQIESQLVDKFCEALDASDVKRMKLYASTLQHFPEGSIKCVTNYINHHVTSLCQAGGGVTEDVFKNMENRAVKVYKQMTEVFDDADDVMMKYIHIATEKYLFDHVTKELAEAGGHDVEQYLHKLYQLHIRAMLLKDSLVKLDSKFDPVFLTKSLRASLFSEHLSGYAESEVKHLEKKCRMFVEEFNLSVGIQRKGTNVTRVANVPNIFDIVSSPEEAYISENVCTSILTESKSSIKRCKELLVDRELCHTVREIFLTVLDTLCGGHFNAALELASDIKANGPTGLFLQVVGCINKNIHLIEKQFRELILPSIQYAPVAAVCNEKKREHMNKLETKIEAGIEKSITCIVNTLSHTLSLQKKTDYKPDEPGIPETSFTCTKAVAHIRECTKIISSSFDGKNLEIILLEFGIRVHRVLYEHILTFTVNSIGAMFLICDVNEYRKVLKEFGSKYLDEVFENLQTLCNLFIVMPENLKQVCSEEPYVSFDRNVIMRMIQLRSDYKTAKIGKVFS